MCSGYARVYTILSGGKKTRPCLMSQSILLMWGLVLCPFETSDFILEF